MSSIIFNCEFCKYQTNKKYNLNRHITTKHKEDVEIYNCDKNYKTKKYVMD